MTRGALSRLRSRISRASVIRTLVALAIVLVTTLAGPFLREFFIESREGEPILVFEKSFRLTDALKPGSLSWSPDGRFIMMKGFFKGRVSILDADSWDGDERHIAEKVGHATLAWTPDSRQIVIAQSVPTANMRLVSASDGQVVARRDYPDRFVSEGCTFLDEPLAIDPARPVVWAACEVRAAKGPIPLALGLDLSDFSEVDRVTVDPARPGFDMFLLRRVRFTERDGRLLLSAMPHLLSPPPPDWPKGQRETRPVAYAFDLTGGAKTPLFPPFEFDEDNQSGYFRRAEQLMLFPDPNFVLMTYSSSSGGRNGVESVQSRDRQFEGYDPTTGTLLVLYGGDEGVMPGTRRTWKPRLDNRPPVPCRRVDPRSTCEYEHLDNGVLLYSVLVPDGNLLIASWSRAREGRGGLVVLDPRTGVVRQRITGQQTSEIALSPDGRRLARETHSGELRIYRVQP